MLQTSISYSDVSRYYMQQNVEKMKEEMIKLNDAINSVQTQMSAITTD